MHHAGCWLFFFFFSLAVTVTLPGNEYWMTVPGAHCQYENGMVLMRPHPYANEYRLQMSVIICLNASI